VRFLIANPKEGLAGIRNDSWFWLKVISLSFRAVTLSCHTELSHWACRSAVEVLSKCCRSAVEGQQRICLKLKIHLREGLQRLPRIAL